MAHLKRRYPVVSLMQSLGSNIVFCVMDLDWTARDCANGKYGVYTCPIVCPFTRRGAWYTFACDTRYVDITAIINLSVTSQLERADFCDSDRST